MYSQVQSHREEARKLQRQIEEKKRIVKIVIIVIGLMIGLLMMKGQKGVDREELKKEVFGQMEDQNIDQYIDELHYIKYDQIANQTDQIGYLKDQVDKHLKGFDDQLIKRED